ncbi:hypothetical protein CLUG_04720 [Clavispora lusitaniae ATCC 42720]|uniref:Uncharacterized protein n=1 Tax=Clavispora lusitaniae (strain ATCC 42720) TaxID=306902 RepID=C4Y943_CLAL4|nr:uncharacterized protein CLUG_04720 [Clavispora lusitaniae ATCC 42720]EEQ40592.1 hypothetical protein CLUG_04720 [Clavispora lusitaniae ATCC 42720]
MVGLALMRIDLILLWSETSPVNAKLSLKMSPKVLNRFSSEGKAGCNILFISKICHFMKILATSKNCTSCVHNANKRIISTDCTTDEQFLCIRSLPNILLALVTLCERLISCKNSFKKTKQDLNLGSTKERQAQASAVDWITKMRIRAVVHDLVSVLSRSFVSFLTNVIDNEHAESNKIEVPTTLLNLHAIPIGDET